VTAAAATSRAPRGRPITFTGPSIPAILADLKHQTRRLIADVPDGVIEVVPSLLAHGGDLWDFRRHMDNPVAIQCPYGAPGDRLWVREAHAQFAVGNRTGLSPQCVAYQATCDRDGGFEYVNNGDEIP
jgi:hypothetical protein